MLSDEASATQQTVSEVELYGDVVLRFVSGTFEVSLAAQMRLAESQRFLSGLHHCAWAWEGVGQGSASKALSPALSFAVQLLSL